MQLESFPGKSLPFEKLVSTADLKDKARMIYRITLDECIEGIPNGSGRMGGLIGSHYACKLLDELGIRVPGLEHKKVRFYFTESGWREAGSFIAAKARRLGHTVRCVRRKEPLDSQVVYRDSYQVAILPTRRK